jgi:uncharacterized membrane protein
MAAAIWIGTNIVQMILAKPNSNTIQITKARKGFQQIGKVFKPLVDICIIVLIATGAIIVFNRLTSNDITVVYVVTLGIKITLTAWMLILLHSERRQVTAISNLNQNSRESGWFNRTKLILSGYNGVTIVGILVFFLSELLSSLFEEILRLN